MRIGLKKSQEVGVLFCEIRWLSECVFTWAGRDVSHAVSVRERNPLVEREGSCSLASVLRENVLRLAVHRVISEVVLGSRGGLLLGREAGARGRVYDTGSTALILGEEVLAVLLDAGLVLVLPRSRGLVLREGTLDEVRNNFE